MKEDAAFKVAYASQHTDDSMYDHAIDFANGGRFQQTLTSWNYEAIGNAIKLGLSDKLQNRVMVPFHFLPASITENGRFREKILCRQNSQLAQQMVERAISRPLEPSSLHRLGITLHVYADTWAHQNFSGLFSNGFEDNRINDAENIRFVKTDTGRTNKTEKLTTKRFLNRCRENSRSKFSEWFSIGKIRKYFLAEAELFTKLGHAQVDTLPDEPFREWGYYHVHFQKDIPEGEKWIQNWLLFLDASLHLYEAIKSFLSKNPEFSTGHVTPWKEIADLFEELFRTPGDIEERCINWSKAICTGKFPFEMPGGELSYDDRLWFRQAIEVESETLENGKTLDRYIRKEGFENSDWKLFHDAASMHRFYLLHQLLPKHGIYC